MSPPRTKCTWRSDEMRLAIDVQPQGALRFAYAPYFDPPPQRLAISKNTRWPAIRQPQPDPAADLGQKLQGQLERKALS